MSETLSQAEIDALLSGAADSMPRSADEDAREELSMQEIDALGEIGNISIGTSATTLFELVGHKVTITTPDVTLTTWEDLAEEYDYPLVAVRVEYTKGLVGTNLLILQERDVKIIVDLMMGGEGKASEDALSDIHLSAIGEVMNQMIGSAATSMSTMFNKRIEISPPKAFIIRLKEKSSYADFMNADKVVRIGFRMVIGDLVDSKIMQLIPIRFAKDLVENLVSIDMEDDYGSGMQEDNIEMQISGQESAMGYDNNWQDGAVPQQDKQDRHFNAREPVKIQPAQFQQLEDERIVLEKKNINLIMDVPLQVTVELGRSCKLIKDILEFSPGSIIELDKLAGDPVDILVNGKHIAKGEVIVIDESFGVRITDIIHPSKRL